MQKVHVHVYEVVRKAEIEYENVSEEECRRDALDKAAKGKLHFKESDDCKFITMSFVIGDLKAIGG